MKIFGPKDIAHYVSAHIRQNAKTYENKVIVDVPAGDGRSSKVFAEVGAKVQPYDLFPEAFDVDGLRCGYADLSKPLPVQNEHADVVLCQEGIEHMSDQFGVLKEFFRVLKPGGTLLISTPNYSALRAKMAYLLGESEIHKLLAPNELDSVWLTKDTPQGRDVYFGHIFMIGAQKLRALSVLAGLELKRVHSVRVNWTSLLLFPFLYPFICINQYACYRRRMRKNTKNSIDTKRKVYQSVLRLGINPKLLLDQHMFIEFRKPGVDSSA